jgi:hypothetical protein
MSAVAKDSVGARPGVLFGERNWRFQAALPTRRFMVEADRLRIVAIYRARACECLERARLARDEGFVAAALGYIDEAETWRQFAEQWARSSTAMTSTADHDSRPEETQR